MRHRSVVRRLAFASLPLVMAGCQSVSQPSPRHSDADRSWSELSQPLLQKPTSAHNSTSQSWAEGYQAFCQKVPQQQDSSWTILGTTNQTTQSAKTHSLRAVVAESPSSNDLLHDQIFSAGLSFDQKIELIISRIDELSTSTITNEWTAKTANYKKDSGFGFQVDFLYWQASEDGLEYAYEILGGPGPVGTATTLPSHRLDVKGTWNPGFRFGIGYNCNNQDQWDILANWTYYHASAHDSATTPTSAGGIYPSWSQSVLGDTASRASAHWRLNFNKIDLELGRDFFLGRSFSLRPHVGLTGVWIYQAYRANYNAIFEGLSSSDVTVNSLANTTYEGNNDFHGVGIRLGGNTLWSFSRSFGLYANIAGGLVYGRFEVEQARLGQAVTPTATALALTPITLTGSNGYNRIRPELEVALGLQYDLFFGKKNYHFSLSAGWEMQQWWSQNQLTTLLFSEFREGEADTPPIVAHDGLDFTVADRNGDLGMQGLTLQVRFDF